MPHGSPSPRLAITIAPDVCEQVLADAARRGVSVSTWMTGAARLALDVPAGLVAMAERETEHGVLTETELKAARRRLASGRQVRRAVRRRRPA